MYYNTILSIKNLLNKSHIEEYQLLSDSFNINCFKLIIDKKIYVAKIFKDKKFFSNSILAEKQNLEYLKSFNLKFFPEIKAFNENILIIDYIKNDDSFSKNSRESFLNAVIKIHSIKSKQFGLNFDTQIGGMMQPNNQNSNWCNFFSENRINYIFELISNSNPMPSEINFKIEKLLKKINNFLPSNIKPTLLHGDLWRGNILFFNNKFAGFIDPGSFYGHNELEITYLKWLSPKFMDNNFIEKYNDHFKIDKNYYIYEPIYQLYYSLMNVYLWNRLYIQEINKILKKIKI